MESLYNDEKCFFHDKKLILFSISKYSNFCPGFFGLNFKIYDVTDQETNNYNTHIKI